MKTINFASTSAMGIEKKNRCEIRTVHPENIFTFPQGILGFEHIREYFFLINEKVQPFMFMQSLEDSSLCFVCIESFLISPDYNFSIPKDKVKFLDLKSPNEALILSLVTVRKNVEEITANLMSPIVINMRNSMAHQLILENDNFPVRFKIWQAIENAVALSNAG